MDPVSRGPGPPGGLSGHDSHRTHASAMSKDRDPYAAPQAPLRDDGVADPAAARRVRLANALGFVTCIGWMVYALRDAFLGMPGRLPFLLAGLLVSLFLAGAPYLLGWAASFAENRTLRAVSAGVSGLYGAGYSWLLVISVSDVRPIGLATSLVLAVTCFASAIHFVRTELAARRATPAP